MSNSNLTKNEQLVKSCLETLIKYLGGEDLLRDDKFLTLVADLYSKIKEYTDYKDDVKAEEVLQFLDEYLEDHRDDDISVFDFFDWYRML